MALRKVSLAVQMDPGSFKKTAQAPAGENQLTSQALDHRSRHACNVPVPVSILKGWFAASVLIGQEPAQTRVEYSELHSHLITDPRPEWVLQARAEARSLASLGPTLTPGYM